MRRRATAFVGVEQYGANSSIGELNKNDIKPSAYEEYLFVSRGRYYCLNRWTMPRLFGFTAPRSSQDLNGYLVLKGAVSKEHVCELNAVLDEMPLDAMQPGDWWGRVHGHA